MPRCRFWDAEGRDKEFLAEYNKNTPQWSNEPDNRTPEQKRWFLTYVSRDLGAKVLNNIVNSADTEILLKNSIDFAGDSLFCEWAYVVDLDKGTFEVFQGFNKEPLADGERFANAPFDHEEYKQVKHRATFRLSELPSVEDFLAALQEEDDREDV